MDSSVGTFEQFKAWLREMRPILPVPLLLVGLEARGWPVGAFRGTDTGSRTRVDLPAAISETGHLFDDDSNVTE